MKHLTRIQIEFIKEARAWEDMSYDDQKGYLSRHPKSKRKLTKQYSLDPTTNNEAEKLSKRNLTKTKAFVIKLWGSLLYMSYDGFKSGEDLSKTKDFENMRDEYMNTQDQDDLDELNEWIDEGARLKNGKSLINKTTIDSIFSSAETKLPEEMIVYKTHLKNDIPRKDRWISTTLNKGVYGSDKNQDLIETQYKLPKGTPVIFTHGLADKDEIIINTNNLPNS